MQSQHQLQEININLLLEAIAKGLTLKQKEEIKEIIQAEKNPETIKTKIRKKFEDFGENVAANIVANLVTNPNMWTSLLALL